MSRRAFPEVPSGYPFPRLELEVLERWRAEEVFRKSLERPAPEGEFVFYEGPPTANNVPHVGHVVTRAVKDLFPRFKTMRGYRVRRKAGWDTHGLAVEIEVEKKLGFSGKRQIEEYGIAAFNQACLESVHTYERQWRAMTERVGYWLDFDDAYWTFTNDYVESVWWALKELSDRGLLYEGFKVQWYCGRCGTGLSSHEVAQNYKETDDPSIWTRFAVRRGQRIRTLDGGELPVEGRLDLVAWTTTPWTTLANVALAADAEAVYVAVVHPEEPETLLVFAEGLATAVPLAVEEDGKRRVLDLRELPAAARFRGRDLDGLLYERLYTHGEPEAPGRVVLADYVTLTDGTGLVHTAPPFGEDDYETSRRYGLPLVFSVDDEGRIKPGFGPWSGKWFKEADAEIVRDLRQRGLLLHTDRYRHNYPFCWRCDRPLLSFARASWFVKTTAARDRLVASNRERIAWRPPHVGEGRFGNWLENVVDWALSRRRYWGTPLPVWKCDLCPAVEVVGSYEQLFQLAGRTPPADLYDRALFDPHRPAIDEVTWPCIACRKDGREGTLRRIEDVIDAWFDSGAMFFAQHHYPFENRPLIDGGGQFPADFISEAIDQTRGWFYTLHALAVLLFDSVAFRNCVVLGHVNDEQGRKMSKRLGNFVEPMGVVEETGADALRWYFYSNDPEQNSRFSARLVKEAAQGLLLPLWNALSFFTIYANLDGWTPGRERKGALGERATLDRWILLRLDELVERVTEGLESYDVASPARLFERFVDDLTNWYIRRSRGRFWAGNPESGDKEAAYQTLYEVFCTLSRLLAPFTPFFAEVLHGHLVRSQGDEAPASVHLEGWPEPRRVREELGREEAVVLVEGMGLVQRVVALGRAARSAHDLKTRQPLAGVTVVASTEEGVQPYLELFGDLIKHELNVKEIRRAERRSEFVRAEVHPNFRTLGKKLGPLVPKVKAALAASDGDALAASLEEQGVIEIEVEGQTVRLEREDVEVRLIEKEGLATAGDRELLVALDTDLTPELVREGLAREFVHKVQAERKERGLDYADRIVVRFSSRDVEERVAVREHAAWIKGETLALELIDDSDPADRMGGVTVERVGAGAALQGGD